MKMSRLFNQLCQYKTLLAAWKQVKVKGSAGGIDGVSVEEVDSRIEQVLTGIYSNRFGEQPAELWVFYTLCPCMAGAFIE